jgi:hypothetical protein
VAGLVRSHAIGAIHHRNPRARVAQAELAGDRQAKDARADDQ